MRLPAEWEKQSGVQLTWPDETTPWYELDKVQECYARIASAVQADERLMIVTASIVEASRRLKEACDAQGLPIDIDKISFCECEINDTWARDHGGISVYGDNGEKYLYDFVFNGWGLKFASDKDNQITKTIFFEGMFNDDVACVDMRPFVLEGGSIDTDGKGTLLTTKSCLCSLNRNEYLTQDEIEGELKQAFGLDRVIWLDHGSIAGDDTDSHVDILARFCSEDTIAYVQCEDEADENYAELHAMEEQLKSLKTMDGKPYTLVPLPLPDPAYLEGYRLPGSYANFLITNGSVLVPGSGSQKDEIARERLQAVFPGRKVKVLDCSALLSGHGGLHCVTMQFPEGWLRK